MATGRYAFFDSSAAINCGTTVKRPPTTPKSATSKTGASASLLTATIVFVGVTYSLRNPRARPDPCQTSFKILTGGVVNVKKVPDPLPNK
jgi:hypothetical protein